jgi:hypothetical protein
MDHELRATMTWYVIGGISEDTQKVPRTGIKIHFVRVFRFERGDHDWHNTVDSLQEMSEWSSRSNETYLLHNFETVRIVTMEDIGTHECKHRHDVVQDRFGRQTSQAGHKEQCLVGRLRVIRNCGSYE